MFHFVIPFLKFIDHNIQVPSVKVPWQDPTHVHHILHLINDSLNQLQTHRLHHHHLHLILVQSAMWSDSIKWQTSIILVTSEQKLQKCYNSYFVSQILQLLKYLLESHDIFMMCLDGLFELGDVTVTEGLKQVVQPLVVCAL